MPQIKAKAQPCHSPAIESAWPQEDLMHQLQVQQLELEMQRFHVALDQSHVR